MLYDRDVMIPAVRAPLAVHRDLIIMAHHFALLGRVTLTSSWAALVQRLSVRQRARRRELRAEAQTEEPHGGDRMCSHFEPHSPECDM